jgi:cell division protein FtsI/penicillin-binding protein 2
MSLSRPRTVSAATATALALVLVASVTGVGEASDHEPSGRARAARAGEGGSAAAARAPSADLLEGFDPLRHALVDGVRVATLRHGRRAILTLDPGLQAHLEHELERYEVPRAAVVAVDPSSGRVLAYVSHTEGGDVADDVVRDASPPAASVFKVVTSAALLDAGVGPGARVCYGGGASRLLPADLRDDPRRDTRCATLRDALGHSINAIIAKLADRNLEPAVLRRYASAFGFGHALPFDVPTEASAMDVPTEPLEFARTAAGFWHMHMSPLHGALLAATVANDGVMPRISMVDRVEDAEGRVLARHRVEDFRSVIPRATARSLARMMELTVSGGTAHGAFFDRAGNAFLPGIAVAGKTGTLTAERPYRGYTWWVGFAPAEHPTIAVAALVVNQPRWRIKASYVAREALRYYLVERPRELRRGG